MKEQDEKTIEDLFRKASITGELCNATIIKYRECLKRFFKIIGDKSFNELEMADLEKFMFIAKEKGNANTGIVGVIYAIKWVLRKMQAQGIVENKIDLDKICKPKIKKEDVAYLTKEEIAKFFAVIYNELKEGTQTRKFRTMALYMLLLESGARISEILSIKIKDINFNDGEIPIIGKGSKPRTLLFRDFSIKWIKRYLDKRTDNCEYLFVNRGGTAKWSYNDVCRSFQRYKKLSGINKKFTIHTFRHTFATQLLLNGVPLNQVSFLLGHANLETTMKYYIGTIKTEEAKRFIKDSHFDFIPTSSLRSNQLVSTP